MTKSSQDERVARILSDELVNESEKIEAKSYTCELFFEGKSFTDIALAINEKFPSLDELVNRETPRKWLKEMAQDKLLTYKPPFANQLAVSLGDVFDWDSERIKVVHSQSFRHVAQVAAMRLLKQIRRFAAYGNLDTVHVGIAGGRQCRLVAENLAQLLQEPSPENPEKIVFHAMVAAFGDDDFEADPNNFITYFLRQPLAVKINFKSILAPGIVETKHRKELRNFRKIDEVYKAAEKLNIIVSGGGDWQDEHSTTQRYLNEIDEHDVQKLRDYPAIGDMLWQPLGENGPIDMDNGGFTFRPNTLVSLNELPAAIQRGVRVLLVLGPCGRCGEPKGNVLNTVLSLKNRLVTDVVTNSPNAYDALRRKWQVSSARAQKPK